MKQKIFSLAVSSILSLSLSSADACTRLLYETGTSNYIVGRTMDWAEDMDTWQRATKGSSWGRCVGYSALTYAYD